MEHNYDAVIVGSGFAGAVTARRLAEAGKRVLVLEKRSHIGGNAYDSLDGAGVLVHRYGPHIFHTNSEAAWRFLSRFTEWHPYRHEVVGSIRGKFVPIPFNLHSVDLCFAPVKAARLRERLIAGYGPGSRVPIAELRRQSDPELRELAEYIFENVFCHYTEKQWGTPPDAVDPSVLKRVPVLVSEDDRYFQDTWQGIPAKGYTALFERMLDYPGVEVRLGTEASERLRVGEDRVYLDGEPFAGVTVYTGALDELCGCSLGRLPYRTLDFQFETLPVTWFQPKGTVNYTVDMPFTRITEFKYFLGQDLPGRTTIVREFARDYAGKEGEIPYYAVKNPGSDRLYAAYLEKISAVPRFYLLGRLAEYQYYNMDAIVARALERADEILAGWEATA